MLLYKSTSPLALICSLLCGCGGSATPLMEWQWPPEDSANTTHNNAFSMPWPNDLLRTDQGIYSLDSFPGVSSNPALKNLLKARASQVHGAGLSSAIYFGFTESLDASSLPEPFESLYDNSPVILVNITEGAPNFLKRVPVRTYFNTVGSEVFPENTLAILPQNSYTLKENNLYAAILFNNLKLASDQPLQAASLVRALRQNQSINDFLPPEKANLIKTHWQSITQYLSDHLERPVEDIIAFSVFTTQDVTSIPHSMAQTVENMSTTELLEHLGPMEIIQPCACTQPEKSCNAQFKAPIDLPVWQEGVSPYWTQGGTIKPEIQNWETTPLFIMVSCNQPLQLPRAVTLRADGSGSGFDNAKNLLNFYAQAERPFNHIALSIAPRHSGERATSNIKLLKAVAKLIGYRLNDGVTDGMTQFNPLNLNAMTGNVIQEAGEQLYLKKIALTLPHYAQKNIEIIHQAGLSLPFFMVDPNKIGLSTHSQGSASVPIALGVDDGWNHAQINAPSSNIYHLLLHRKSVRQALDRLIPISESQSSNEFIPVLQLAQYLLDASNSLHFIPDIQVDHLLVSAGYFDGCVPREASEDFMVTLGRYGKVQPAFSVQLGFMPATMLKFGTVSPLTLPVSGNNLSNGNSGIALMLPTGHGAKGAKHVIGEFLYSVTDSGVPHIPEYDAPKLQTPWTCDGRVE